MRPGTIEENAYVQGEGWGGGGALIQRPDVKMLMGKDRVRRSPGGALQTARDSRREGWGDEVSELHT